jgi:hypothetical protein
MNKWIYKFILDGKKLVIIAFIDICWFYFLNIVFTFLIRPSAICTTSMWTITISFENFFTIQIYRKWMNEQNEQNSFSQE